MAELYYQQTEADYQILSGIRSTQLKDVLQSKEAYFAKLEEEEEEKKDSLIVGNAAHCAILTPDLYPMQYTTRPEVDGRTTDGKKIIAEWKEHSEGMTVLTAKQAGRVARMTMALKRHPLASATLAAGVHELGIRWQQDGYWFKARLDAVDGQSGAWFADYKTIGKYPSIRAIRLAMVEYLYHLQFAHYAEAVRAHWGFWPECYAVFQMSKAPYTVHTLLIPGEFLLRGGELRLRALDLLAEIDASDKAPLDFPDCTVLAMPPWAYRDEGVEVIE